MSLTNLLWERECNARLKGASHKCALVVMRAQSDTDADGVDLSGGRLFEEVDDAADALDPGSHGTGVSDGAIEVEGVRDFC